MAKRMLCVSLLAVAGMIAADAGKGISLYRERQYSAAADELRAAVKADPENREARYYLALSLVELEKFREAEAQIATLDVEESAPTKAQIKTALARAQMGQKEFSKAGANLEDARAEAPDDPEVLLRVGELRLHNKDYQSAAEVLDQAIQLKPDLAYAHYYAGIAYSNLKRADKMVDHFQYFLKLAPDAPEANKVQSLLRGLRR